jgi:ketosteroid isomerase-like protein
MNKKGDMHEDAIRTARAASNLAIANHDLDAIARVWMDDVLVLGSTSVQLLGAKANRRFYAAQFARRSDTSWVRIPSLVSALSPWRVALEEGDWSGRWTEPDGPIEVRGRYMAQWVLTASGWRIQGELYVPTACAGGAYCERPPR